MKTGDKRHKHQQADAIHEGVDTWTRLCSFKRNLPKTSIFTAFANHILIPFVSNKNN